MPHAHEANIRTTQPAYMQAACILGPDAHRLPTPITLPQSTLTWTPTAFYFILVQGSQFAISWAARDPSSYQFTIGGPYMLREGFKGMVSGYHVFIPVGATAI